MGIPLDKAELLAIFLETFFFGVCRDVLFLLYSLLPLLDRGLLFEP